MLTDVSWHDSVSDLALASAVAIVVTDPRPDQSAWVSITLAGKALVTTDVLLAHTGCLNLNHISEVRCGRRYALSVRPIQLGILSGAPIVHVYCGGLDAPVSLRLTLQLQVQSRLTRRTSVITHEFDAITLDADAPTVRFTFPWGAIDPGPARGHAAGPLPGGAF